MTNLFKNYLLTASFLTLSIMPVYAETNAITPNVTTEMNHVTMMTGDHEKMMATGISQSTSTILLLPLALPTEAGQDAFAVISEIVELLQNDPNTDWSKVNINSLREHLVDMSNLTLGAIVEQKIEGVTAIYIVTGRGGVLRAIQAMVPRHALELDKIPNWEVATETIKDGVILKITSTNEIELVKINALGFFGLMATGAHHQPHHFGMATGNINLHQ
ncbi:MAG: hypothetical protein HRU29_10930 [Rhizobiales bacterium]|nr:hypothetical protein [Hyphomicrobiales bacterium]NRB14907.1 hypothetical protein [Hyphomicrobiales bacterium]